MKYEVGFRCAYEIDCTPEIDPSGRTTSRSSRMFVEWDGNVSFYQLMRKRVPVVFGEHESYTYNHRVEIDQLRIGGTESRVILKIEPQIIKA